MTRFVFVNCIAAGSIDWKQPLTAPGQPPIGECAMIGIDTEDESFRLEMTEPSVFNLNVYNELVATGAVVVGHSVEFHHGMLRAALIARAIDPHDGLVQTVDTMLQLTGHVTKANGKRGWPTFSEACSWAGVERAAVETAEDNARCLMAVFRAMQAAGINPAVRVWKDRNAG